MDLFYKPEKEEGQADWLMDFAFFVLYAMMAFWLYGTWNSFDNTWIKISLTLAWCFSVINLITPASNLLVKLMEKM